MELTGKKWENFSTKQIKTDNYFGCNNKLKTLSLGELIDDLNEYSNELKNDNVNIYDLPVLIDYSFGTRFTINKIRSFGEFCAFSISDRENKLIFEEPDVRPEFGEYCEIDYRCDNGLIVNVKTKNAGMRLLRTVKYVLENDDIKSRFNISDSPYAPHRFKFSADEFDLNTLEDLICDNNDIVDEHILRKSIKKEDE